MTEYAEGTVLTCSHEDCPCRMRVEVACHCATAGEPYRCTCGAPMVEVATDPETREPSSPS